MKPRLLLGLACSAALVATPALADDKAACLDAAAQGQSLRDAHKLIEARQQLRTCAAAGCPAVVQRDCTDWLADLDKALPTVVVTARNGAGAALVDVKVTVDGQPLLSKLDGQALPMNAGPHTFHFEGIDGALDQQVVVNEGEKDQKVAVVLGAAPTPAPPAPAPADAPSLPAAPATPAPPEDPGSGLGTQKILGVVAGGIGIVGLGVGSAFSALALSQKSDAQSACPNSPCMTHDGSNKWSTAASTGNVATVGFLVGGAGVVAGGLLWFTAPRSTSTQVGFGPGSLQVKGTW
jgi:hypothetical protein